MTSTMKNLLFPVLGGFVLFAASPASAQDVDCKRAVAQMDMNICAQQSYDSADAELNTVYKRVRAGLSAADQLKLLRAERAWIARRDAACDDEASGSIGGSIHPMEISLCLAKRTKARTLALKSVEEGCRRGDAECSATKALVF